MRSPKLECGQWYDFDYKWVWATFDTYQWHIENDITLEYLNWCVSTNEDIGEEQRKSSQEMLDIYYWWLNYKEDIAEINKLWNAPDTTVIGRNLYNLEIELDSKIPSYLHRLVDIKSSVWS